MIDVVTTVEKQYEKWTVSVRNKADVTQQWWRNFTDGLEAHQVAFQLGLVKRSQSATASAFALNNRYRSEDESVADESVLTVNGFRQREVIYRFRLIDPVNMMGEIISPRLTRLPTVGEIIPFSQSVPNGNHRVKGIHGPYIQNEAVTIIVECEPA